MQSHPHFLSFVKACRENQDAIPFMLGFLLSDIDDAQLCAALASWSVHLTEMEDLYAEGLVVVQADVHDPRD